MQALRATVLAKQAATILALNLRYREHCTKLWAQKAQIQRQIEKGFVRILSEIDVVATQQKASIARQQKVDIQDLLPSLSAFDDPAGEDVEEDSRRQQKAEMLQAQGNAFSKQKRYAEAIERYSEAIEFSESFKNRAVLYCNRAAAHSKLKCFEEVARDSRKAHQIDPGYIKAYVREGLALQHLGRFREAHDAYSKALSVMSTCNDNNRHKHKLADDIRLRMRVCQDKMDAVTEDGYIYRSLLFTANCISDDRSLHDAAEPLGQNADSAMAERNSKLFRCCYLGCQHTSDSRREVLTHEVIHLRPKKRLRCESDEQGTSSRPRFFECDLCSDAYTFDDKASYDQHMMTHTS